MHMMRSCSVAAVLGLAALLAGCGGSSTAPQPLAGQWQGVSSLPNGYSTNLTLTQNGADVSGTMTISGVETNGSFAGTFDGTQVTWTGNGDCGGGTLALQGTLTVQSGDKSMSGPFTMTPSGCNSLSGTYSGTLSLTHQ